MLHHSRGRCKYKNRKKVTLDALFLPLTPNLTPKTRCNTRPERAEALGGNLGSLLRQQPTHGSQAPRRAHLTHAQTQVRAFVIEVPFPLGVPHHLAI
jgi:hypothetical protein